MEIEWQGPMSPDQAVHLMRDARELIMLELSLQMDQFPRKVYHDAVVNEVKALIHDHSMVDSDYVNVENVYEDGIEVFVYFDESVAVSFEDVCESIKEAGYDATTTWEAVVIKRFVPKTVDRMSWYGIYELRNRKDTWSKWFAEKAREILREAGITDLADDEPFR